MGQQDNSYHMALWDALDSHPQVLQFRNASFLTSHLLYNKTI